MKKILIVALVMILIGGAMIIVGLAFGATTSFNCVVEDGRIVTETVEESIDLTEEQIENFFEGDEDLADEYFENRQYVSVAEGELEYGKFEEVIKDFPTDSLEIDIVLEHYDVKILKGEDDEVKVVYERVELKDDILHDLTLNSDGDEEVFINEKTRSGEFKDMVAARAPRATIYLPGNLMNEKDSELTINIVDNSLKLNGLDVRDVDIECLGADVVVEKNYWQEGSVDVLNGDLNIVDSRLEKTDIDATVGRLNFENTRLADVSLDTLNSSIDGSIEVDGKVEVEFEDGQVTLDLKNDRDEVAVVNENGVDTFTVDGEVFTGSDAKLDRIITIDTEWGHVELSFE